MNFLVAILKHSWHDKGDYEQAWTKKYFKNDNNVLFEKFTVSLSVFIFLWIREVCINIF